ncbi:MAG: T9SS type A sorting domain-containing protein [Candidatus Eisenbacteria bacterium]|nr:T9SS type A sorting domain-containing protein [Candidatus Eisenbacteria bacterium]
MKRLLLVPILALGFALALPPAAHAAFTGTLYGTYFSGHTVARVSVTGGLVSGSPVTITALDGSDGITCTPGKTELIVGGQLSNNIYKVDPATGTFTQLNNNIPDLLPGAFHVVFNPAGTQVWTGGFYNANVGWVDYATGATHQAAVTGTDNGVITGVVFAPNGDLYVSDADEHGGGSIYLLNTTTFATTKVFTSAKTSHGLVYDAYTGHFLVMGALLGRLNFRVYCLLGDGESQEGQVWEAALAAGNYRCPNLIALLDYNQSQNEGPLVYLDLTAATPAPVISGDLGFGLDDVTGCISAPPPPPEDCSNKALSWGFWKQQCSTSGGSYRTSGSGGGGYGGGSYGGGGHGGKGGDDGEDRDHHGGGNVKVSPEEMAKLLACVTASSQVFGPSGCFTASCALLNTKTTNMQIKAAQQYLAMLLNKCSGRVCDDLVVTCGGRCGMGGTQVTVGDVIARIESRLCLRGLSQSEYAELNGLAECVNTSAESGGSSSSSDMVESIVSVPNFRVALASGNPVRLSGGNSVIFRVNMPSLGVVSLSIYDAAGRLVAQPLRDRAVGGETTVSWDGRTLMGARGQAGAYFYRARAGSQTVTGKFVVIE